MRNRDRMPFVPRLVLTVAILIVGLFFVSKSDLGETFVGAWNEATGKDHADVAVELPEIDFDFDYLDLGNDVSDLEVEAPRDIDYDREGQFGRAWLDVDQNGCDTRNDILQRDLTDLEIDDDGCTVLSGHLLGPMTGKDIDFVRGRDTSLEVQIDHIVPLSKAARHGALDWTQEEREEFANDPINLLAMDGPTNGKKGDDGPGDWLPSNEAFTCDYVAMYAQVVTVYELTVPPQDADMMETVLTDCS